MSATKSLPRIPTTGNTFAELVFHLADLHRMECVKDYREHCPAYPRLRHDAWPTVPHMLACALVPISRKLHKLAEDMCNIPEPSEGHWHKARERLLKQAERILPDSIKIDYKTDPRAGYGLGLIFPDGRTNDWVKECIVVPCKVTE